MKAKKIDYNKINVVPKKTKTPTRIYKWFIGVMNGEEVNFRFTYSKDMDSQVKIKNCITNDIISTNIDFFNSNVKPIMVSNAYVMA